MEFRYHYILYQLQRKELEETLNFFQSMRNKLQWYIFQLEFLIDLRLLALMT